MITRTNGDTVTFLHPFKLRGADDVQPAGNYFVETDEELIPSLSFAAYRRISTFIHLAGRPDSYEVARVVDIDPAELTAALEKDAQAPEAAPTLSDRMAAEIDDKEPGATAVVSDLWNRWLGLNATELKLTAMVIGGVALAALFA